MWEQKKKRKLDGMSEVVVQRDKGICKRCQRTPD